MTDEDLYEFDSAVRMSDFAAANNGIIKNNAKALSGFASLDASIAALETSGAARVSSSGLRTDGTADKAAAKSALLAYVRKIAKTAKTIKTEEPDFDNKFKLPRGGLSGEALLETAQAFATDLPPVADKFAEYAVTGTPVDKLNDFITAFEAARTQQNTGKGGGVAATAQTRATMKNLKKTRRTLKMVVTNILEDLGDAGLLAEWKSASRVERAAKKKTDEPPTV